MSANTKSNQSGFTVAELIVAITAGSVVALVVLSISLYFFADVMRSNAQTQLVAEAQIALNRVVEDMRTGSAILLNNIIVDVNEPTGGWTTSNADLVLIVQTPSTTASGEFIFDSSSGNPYQDEFIYFTDEDRLYKRILANTNAPGNSAQTTCPLLQVSPSCPEDRLLTENFSDMTFVFYDQDNSLTTDPTVARSTEVTINMFRLVFGREVTAQNVVRMSLRNPQS